jgi:hypothetical protein
MSSTSAEPPNATRVGSEATFRRHRHYSRKVWPNWACGTCPPDGKKAVIEIYEDTMTLKFPAATRAANAIALLLAAAAIVAVGFSPTDASAAKRKVYDRSSAYGPSEPNASYQSGPRTRVYISKRSWLDAGTEVLPGERKFSDYAFPPAVGYPSFARENLNRPIDRQPLSSPADLGGYPTAFPLY